MEAWLLRSYAGRWKKFDETMEIDKVKEFLEPRKHKARLYCTGNHALQEIIMAMDYFRNTWPEMEYSMTPGSPWMEIGWPDFLKIYHSRLWPDSMLSKAIGDYDPALGTTKIINTSIDTIGLEAPTDFRMWFGEYENLRVGVIRRRTRPEPSLKIEIFQGEPKYSGGDFFVDVAYLSGPTPYNLGHYYDKPGIFDDYNTELRKRVVLGSPWLVMYLYDLMTDQEETMFYEYLGDQKNEWIMEELIKYADETRKI
jgi:hypothetical protein